MKDTAIPESAPHRIDWLDALRGWAVLGVVITHSGQTAHSPGMEGKIAAAGQYGVQLFFVVSALTISITYESHIARYGSSVRSQFAWLIKRFFRIAPIYYLAALFYPVEQYAIYTASHQRYGSTTTVPNILANFLFLHTWIPSANNSVVPGGWSIGVEMFFYLLVPFVWLIAPVMRRIAVLGIGAAAFLIATVVVCKLSTGSYDVVDNGYFYYWFPTQAPVLVIGLIFYFARGRRLQSAQSAVAAAGCLIGFLLCIPAGLYFGIGMEVAPVVVPTIFAASFIFLILSLRGWIKSIVVNKYAIFLGQISFSVYIFHFVVLDVIRGMIQAAHLDRSSSFTLVAVLVLTLACTSVIALISKRAIEDPAIAYGHELSRAIALR